MPELLDQLYRQYCRARLAEMRSQLQLRPDITTSLNDVDAAAITNASAIDRDAVVAWGLPGVAAGIKHANI